MIGLAGSVASTGMLINLRDAYNDERFDATMDEMSGYRTRQVRIHTQMNV